MRTLARRIEAIVNWGVPPSDWQPRILTTPLFRYASEPDKIIARATFAFTQGGTNPEGISLIEAIAGKNGEARWRSVVTRLTAYGVKATLNETVIADLPRLQTPVNDAAFFVRSYEFGAHLFPVTELVKSKTEKGAAK